MFIDMAEVVLHWNIKTLQSNDRKPYMFMYNALVLCPMTWASMHKMPPCMSVCSLHIINLPLFDVLVNVDQMCIT